MVKMSEFTIKVMAMVKKIPKGKVATYGQIAKLAGKPHGARGVGWILHSSSESYELPWHRVLNSQGKISFHSFTKEYKKQKALLLKEGVQFHDRDKIDLSKFQWKKRARPIGKKLQKGPRMFSNI